MGEPGEALDAVARRVIGAAIEVHRELGAGFIEAVYEQALSIELKRQGIAFVCQATVPIHYKGEPAGEARLDLLVEDQLVVELKAVEVLLPLHAAQVRNYLKATGHQLALLINFNVPLIKDGLKRIVLTT